MDCHEGSRQVQWRGVLEAEGIHDVRWVHGILGMSLALLYAVLVLAKAGNAITAGHGATIAKVQLVVTPSGLGSCGSCD